ncbi:lipocalin family protein [Lysobacter solisilvae (ex Woo and Kim 2020)]|uniref:Outer membrane lipoprotein Blc n=1 Tax=Agrilutibacter terrestris TaxID=2865112 RepID=A0A7H0G0E7_9GAMM|nr:lipocalin family protein [Lysobacter terrestris]QNP41763.1 lipocalin family protein [Lysobacter terrestris]
MAAGRFLGVLLVLAAVADAGAQSLPNQPVPALDLQRYAGTWHEIAHLPMFFQRKCVDTITATYTPRPDGTIMVRNACRGRDGTMVQADGVARPAGGRPGALEVRFAPRWLSWLPAVWADYWVVELDPDYRWAVVGGPSRKYLWVLSREPDMPRSLFEEIRARAAARGYRVDRLQPAAPLR